MKLEELWTWLKTAAAFDSKQLTAVEAQELVVDIDAAIAGASKAAHGGAGYRDGFSLGWKAALDKVSSPILGLARPEPQDLETRAKQFDVYEATVLVLDKRVSVLEQRAEYLKIEEKKDADATTRINARVERLERDLVAQKNALHERIEKLESTLSAMSKALGG